MHADQASGSARQVALEPARTGRLGAISAPHPFGFDAREAVGSRPVSRAPCDAGSPARLRPMTVADNYADVWVVLPTYNEIENLPEIAPAILEHLPGATLLVVDDSSPDGTGELADRWLPTNSSVRVLHRPGKEGLGRAYVDGFRHALAGGAGRVVQMDADWSHDPNYLPGIVGRLAGSGPAATVPIWSSGRATSGAAQSATGG